MKQNSAMSDSDYFITAPADAELNVLLNKAKLFSIYSVYNKDY